MEIAVAGHICLDIIPAWDQGGIESIKPGQLVEMDGIDFSTGGAVANTGLALKKLGTEIGLVGKIANDEVGNIILNILKKQGQDIADSMIISDNEISSYTVVINPPDTDRVFLHYPGTNNTFTAVDMDINNIKEAALFHFGYPPLMKTMYQNQGSELVNIFKKVKNSGLVTSLDMAMPDPDSEAGQANWNQILKNVLPYVDIFLPSLEEILYMLGEKDFNLEEDSFDLDLLKKIGDKLLQMGTKIVVIKLGDQGLYLQTGQGNWDSSISEMIDTEQWSQKFYLSPCYQAEVIGTTGAGDATIAGFLAQFVGGETPEVVMSAATGVGADCVQAVDAISGLKHMDKVMEKINNGWKREAISLDLEGWEHDEQWGLWKRK